MTETARRVFGGGPVALLVLPGCFAVAMVVLRASAGPFWMWYSLDPDYFYLLDSLNLINLTTPGHIAHPGVTVETLGALILKAAYGTAGAEEITGAVLADPESHLRLISSVIVGLNAVALLALGVAAQRAFGAMLPALAVQTGPFLSMLVLKQGYQIKPESLLILATLLLALVTVLALREGALDRRRIRFAIAFGAAIGFGVATKVTFAPLWVLPLFLLASARAITVYALVSVAAFALFALPAAGAYQGFFQWMASLAVASDVHGHGASTVIDPLSYPADLLQLFKRPIFLVVFLASLVVLVAAWRRHRAGRAVAGLEARALAGVVGAQLAQLLVVAKHPSAIYIAPSLMLSALAAALVYRIVVKDGEGLGTSWLWPGRAAAAVLILLAATQTFGIVKTDGEFRVLHRAAHSLNNDRFKTCARIYFLHASSRSFAFYLSSFVTGETFAALLRAQQPDNDYWLENWWEPARVQLRNWNGPQSLPAVIERYPCVFLRGSFADVAARHIAEVLPETSFSTACSTAEEAIFTLGVDCDGRVDEPRSNAAGRGLDK